MLWLVLSHSFSGVPYALHYLITMFYSVFVLPLSVILVLYSRSVRIIPHFMVTLEREWSILF
jgi:hypothetical protein